MRRTSDPSGVGAICVDAVHPSHSPHVKKQSRLGELGAVEDRNQRGVGVDLASELGHEQLPRNPHRVLHCGKQRGGTVVVGEHVDGTAKLARVLGSVPGHEQQLPQLAAQPRGDVFAVIGRGGTGRRGPDRLHGEGLGPQPFGNSLDVHPAVGVSRRVHGGEQLVHQIGVSHGVVTCQSHYTVSRIEIGGGGDESAEHVVKRAAHHGDTDLAQVFSDPTVVVLVA